jgi:hypothetical protein
VADGEQAFLGQTVEVVGGQRAADPGGGGHLFPTDRPGLLSDVLVDAPAGVVAEGAQCAERIHARRDSNANER